MAQRIVITDGAMGTMIQSYGLGEADYRGDRFADHPKSLLNNSDVLSLTQPDIIREIHTRFLEAGADIIESNSFTATSVAQADFGLERIAAEINLEAARRAREGGRRVQGRPAAVGRRLGRSGPTTPRRSRPTSRTRAFAPSTSTGWPAPTPRRPRR